MEVAFVSEFTEGQRVFRHLDTAGGECPVRVGDGHPLEETYCARVVDGRLPHLINDTSRFPATAEIAATADLPVGAHLSVPIVMTDGTTFGTFCCFSSVPDLTLTERDLAMMQVFAELAAHNIEAEQARDQQDTAVMTRLRPALYGESLTMLFQPIVDLSTGRPSGYEALARFAGEPPRGPDLWFADARSVGLEVELDLSVLRATLDYAADLPADAYLALNVTPTTVASGRLEELCDLFEPSRTVLEITEHDAVESYEDIASHLGPLRERGFRLAVDDAGSGYASLQHILRLAPDIIKLDMSLTRGVDTRPAQKALVSAMLAFADATQAVTIAEGVETPEELNSLRSVGVGHVQGYHLGRPAPLPGVRDSLGRTSTRVPANGRASARGSA